MAALGIATYLPRLLRDYIVHDAAINIGQPKIQPRVSEHKIILVLFESEAVAIHFSGRLTGCPLTAGRLAASTICMTLTLKSPLITPSTGLLLRMQSTK
jgi:hypothetical protein